MVNKKNMKCPVCNSTNIIDFAAVKDVEYGTINELFAYKDCRKCKSIFLQDPPVKKLSLIYPDNYYSVDGVTNSPISFLQALQKIKDFLDKRLFSNALKSLKGNRLSVLDVGGGAGWVMNLIKQSDKRISMTTIIDINENSRKLAEKNGHVFICDVVESLNSKNEFDFVVMLNLIEHVANPKKVLSIIHASLRAGGLLMIKTPNTQSLNRRIFQKYYWGGLHAPRHWVIFNKLSFTKIAQEAGFIVEEFKYTQGAPQWAASILGTLRQKQHNLDTKPMHLNPLFSILNLLFAILDFLLMPFCKSDQMIFLLKKMPSKLLNPNVNF